MNISIKRGNNSTHEREMFDNETFDKENQVSTVRPQNMLTEQIAAKHARCKSKCPFIDWSGSQPEQIILNLSIHGRSIQPDTAFQRDMVRELEGLLGYLFSEAQELLVEPLSYGFSNARVVKVQPFYTEGAAQHVVLKFGDTQTIEQEYKCYRKYVQRFIGDGRSTTILDHQCTMYLGGIVYSFLGTATQHLQSFGAFYHQASIEHIKKMLDSLFRSTCGIWYANHDSLGRLNLTEDYQKQSSYTLEQLQDFLGEHFPGIRDQETLSLPSFQSKRPEPFPNPFSTIKTLPDQRYTTYMSTTHGDFNQHNILIDQAGYPWLIDFQSTGPSHILRDVATLDTVIRLQLLTPKQAILDERLALEEALCSIRHFNQIEQLEKAYSFINPELSKIWKTITHLRTIAYRLVELNVFHNIKEYYAALLYNTINTLSFSSLSIEQYEHALISAGLLIDRLKS